LKTWRVWVRPRRGHLHVTDVDGNMHVFNLIITSEHATKTVAVVVCFCTVYNLHYHIYVNSYSSFCILKLKDYVLLQEERQTRYCITGRFFHSFSQIWSQTWCLYITWGRCNTTPLLDVPPPQNKKIKK